MKYFQIKSQTFDLDEKHFYFVFLWSFFQCFKERRRCVKVKSAVSNIKLILVVDFITYKKQQHTGKSQTFTNTLSLRCFQLTDSDSDRNKF